MSYGSLLRAAREARDWSRRHLAEIIPCSIYTITSWEKGTIPQLERQRRLRDVLGVPLAQSGDLPIAPTLRDLVRATERTQTEVARALGVSYQAFVDWQKGRMFPSLAHQQALADILCVDLSTLRRAIARSVAIAHPMPPRASAPAAVPDTPPSPHLASESV